MANNSIKEQYVLNQDEEQSTTENLVKQVITAAVLEPDRYYVVLIGINGSIPNSDARKRIIDNLTFQLGGRIRIGLLEHCSCIMAISEDNAGTKREEAGQ